MIYGLLIDENNQSVHTKVIYISVFVFFCRCKEGYRGLRCDQFVPKTDSILSDPSMYFCHCMFSLRENMRESFYFVCFIQEYRKNECGLDKHNVIELFPFLLA